MYSGIKRASLLNKNLTDFKRLQKLQHFFKFTILRHPLERLVSGYRNKIEPTLFGLSKKFPNPIKHDILRKYRSKEFSTWLKDGGKYNITISFSEFVNYFLDSDKRRINPHFKPFVHTCHPCQVQYDFFGNFRTYGSDVRLVSEAYGLSYSWYRNKSLHSWSQETRALLKKYYDQLSPEMKRDVLHSLEADLELYYLLYPDEKELEAFLKL